MVPCRFAQRLLVLFADVQVISLASAAEECFAYGTRKRRRIGFLQGICSSRLNEKFACSRVVFSRGDVDALLCGLNDGARGDGLWMLAWSKGIVCTVILRVSLS